MIIMLLLCYFVQAELTPIEQTSFFYNVDPTVLVCTNSIKNAETYENCLEGPVEPFKINCGQHTITGLKKKDKGWLFEHITEGQSGRIFLADYVTSSQEDLIDSLKEKVTKGLDFFYNNLKKLKQVINKNHTEICKAFQMPVYAPDNNRTKTLPDQPPPNKLWDKITDAWSKTYAWITHPKNVKTVVSHMTGVEFQDYDPQSTPDFLKFSLKTLIVQGNLSQFIPHNLDQMPNLLILQQSKWTDIQKQAVENLLMSIKETSHNFDTTNDSDIAPFKKFLETISVQSTNPQPFIEVMTKQTQTQDTHLTKFLKNNYHHMIAGNWYQIGWNIFKEILVVFADWYGLSTTDMTEIDRFLFNIFGDIIEHHMGDLLTVIDAFDIDIGNLPTQICLTKEYFQPECIKSINNILEVAKNLGEPLSSDCSHIQSIKKYLRQLDIQWVTLPSCGISSKFKPVSKQ